MVTGGSYGGHMTLAVATLYNDLIACSVDIVGMSNLVTFLEHTEPYRRDLRRVEYGDERDPKMREFLESIAPMNHVKNITKPMMVVAGVNDPRVPKSEADQIVKVLEDNKTPVWYLAARTKATASRRRRTRTSSSTRLCCSSRNTCWGSKGGRSPRRPEDTENSRGIPPCRTLLRFALPIIFGIIDSY